MNPRVAVSAVGVSAVVLLVAITGAHKDKPAAATVAPSFPQVQLDNVATLVRAHGYSCKTPISARNMLVSTGFVLHCRGDRPNAEYWFDIEDRGGKLLVGPH